MLSPDARRTSTATRILFGQLSTRNAAGRHLTASNVPYPGVEFGPELGATPPTPGVLRAHFAGRLRWHAVMHRSHSPRPRRPAQQRRYRRPTFVPLCSRGSILLLPPPHPSTLSPPPGLPSVWSSIRWAQALTGPTGCWELPLSAIAAVRGAMSGAGLPQLQLRPGPGCRSGCSRWRSFSSRHSARSAAALAALQHRVKEGRLPATRHLRGRGTRRRVPGLPLGRSPARALRAGRSYWNDLMAGRAPDRLAAWQRQGNLSR